LQIVLSSAAAENDFPDRFTETDTKRLPKPFYSKTILQIVLSSAAENDLKNRFTP